MILGDAYLRNARFFPQQIALTDPRRAVTHAQFLDRVVRLINALVEDGAKPQDRLAVLSFNCVEMVEIMGAAELGGFIGLPLNHRLAIPEFIDIVRDATPRVLFYQNELAPQAEAISAATGVPLIRLDAPPGQTSEFELLIDSSGGDQLLQLATESDGVQLVYTSGRKSVV